MHGSVHAFLLSLFLAAPASAATMAPVKMKVVDEADGTPVAGLVAMFWGRAREGTLTGHGGKHAVLFAAEAVSDDAGELSFAKQEFNPRPFFLNTTLENPAMLLLKPGYAPHYLFNHLMFPSVAEASRWDYNGRTVRLKRSTPEAMKMGGYTIATYTDSVAGFDKNCMWKRVPRTLVAADRMFPDPGKPNTLRTLLANDALFARHGCGSPTEFFAPYLRP